MAVLLIALQPLEREREEVGTEGRRTARRELEEERGGVGQAWRGESKWEDKDKERERWPEANTERVEGEQIELKRTMTGASHCCCLVSNARLLHYLCHQTPPTPTSSSSSSLACGAFPGPSWPSQSHRRPLCRVPGCTARSAPTPGTGSS